MKSTLRYTALAIMAALCNVSYGQDLRTGYFTDSNLYRHDLNPAMDNEENYYSIPFVGNIDVNMMGNFGYEQVVRKNPLYPDRSDKKVTSFMNPYLNNNLKGFSSGDNKINGQLKETVMSVGFKKWGGYNTIELNVRGSVNLCVPYKLFQFAAEAENQAYDVGDVNMSGQLFAELSAGHSRQVNDKLRVGGKAKVLVGMADINVKMEDVMINLSEADKWAVTAKAQSDVSMSGFKYLTKTRPYYSQDGRAPHVTDIDAKFGGPSGFGLALDAGVVYKVNDDFKVSASLLDLGAIVWTNDYRAANDKTTFIFDGFHDVSADSSSPNKLDNKADSYADQLLDFANLRDKGDEGVRITGIGATVSAGCEYTIPTYRMLKIGLLGTSRLNGPYSWTEARLTGNISPVDWFDGAVSLGINNYTASFGFLANFHTKKFNFFLGMDSLLGKMSSELIPLSSNGGVSLGFNIKM